MVLAQCLSRVLSQAVGWAAVILRLNSETSTSKLTHLLTPSCFTWLLSSLVSLPCRPLHTLLEGPCDAAAGFLIPGLPHKSGVDPSESEERERKTKTENKPAYPRQKPQSFYNLTSIWQLITSAIFYA